MKLIKLNNKGYITIEVLIASIVAAVIAVFLIEITVKLVGRTDDAYVDAVLNTDKALIIKNIKDNIRNDINNYGVIKGLICSNDKCNITYENNSKIIFVNDKNVRYCSGENNCSYEKTIDNGISKLSIRSKNKDIDNEKYIFIQITAENIFTEQNYTINIPVLNS